MAPSIPGGRRLFACIYIGGSKFVAGICDEGGDILCSTRHEWSGVSEGQILEQVASAMGEELAEHPGLRNRVVAGGVTIPGFADPKRGIWVDSDYLDVHDLPICDFLANRLRLPFFGDNDCNACALAEHYFGTAKGARDFLYITVSSGIGGGIFLGDRLFYGDRQLAGEIGLTVVEDRPRPEFSRFPRGRLEDYCSTRGMRTTYVSLGGTAQSSFGGREIAAAARAEDPAALETMRLEGVYLARAIARMDAVAAPSQVVVGGGISLAFPDYGPSLFSELNRIRPQSSLQVKPSILGYQGALLGACACAVRGLSSPLDEASLPGSGSELRITSSHGKTACRLLCGGEDLLPAGAGDLGSFLVASGASDEGIELDGLLGGVPLGFLVRRAEQGNADDLGAVERFGRSLGAAVSYCATLLDPAAIVFEDDLAAAEGLYREEVLGAIEDDSYWQREGLPYVIEWCPPRPKGR